MKKLFLLFLIASQSAFANTIDDLEILAKEAREIYSPNLEYKLPEIVFINGKEINIQVCGGNCPPGFRVVGLYSNGKIFLRDTWDAQDDYNASYFVHEFVHHLQFLDGTIVPGNKGTCIENARTEFVAYSVQNQWLMRRGKGIPYRMIHELSFISAGCSPDS
jgi:hypothetical protein